MKEGRTADARRCLARVIYYEPTSPRAYRKYLKSFFADSRAASDSAHRRQ